MKSNPTLSVDKIQMIINHIKNVVNANGAIKGVDLALKIVQNLHPYEFPHESYQSVIEQMVKQGAIKEIEYILADMPDRVKSIYLPAGTTVNHK